MSIFNETREALPYIRTYSGVKYRHLHPLPEDINIEDIAHALSMLCRFTGHTKEFYSVAEHSVRVSYILPRRYQLWGLLHDASETYCNDLARPLKYLEGLKGYKKVEKLTQQTICKRFGLLVVEPKAVKNADNILLATEGRDLFDCEETWGDAKPLAEKIVPWTPEEAKRRFLMRFYELTNTKEFYKNEETTLQDQTQLASNDQKRGIPCT